MPLILALNTASKESALALIEKDKILGETAWISHADESVTVLPSIEQLLRNARKTWKDLIHVFVITGPGGYTSVRVGITIANGIAWTLKIPILATDVFTLWEHRLTPEARVKPHRIVIAAGRDRFQTKDDPTPSELSELQASGLPLFGEVPGATAPAYSFGEAVVQCLPKARETDLAEPLYARPPHITTPGSA